MTYYLLATIAGLLLDILYTSAATPRHIYHVLLWLRPHSQLTLYMSHVCRVIQVTGWLKLLKAIQGKITTISYNNN